MRLGEKGPEFRECVLCGARARFNVQKLADEPVIVSLNLTLYLRNASGQHHLACKRVCVCESDLRDLLAWRHGQGKLGDEAACVGYASAIKLVESILDKLEGPYKATREAKKSE